MKSFLGFSFLAILLASCSPKFQLKEGSKFEILNIKTEINPQINPEIANLIHENMNTFIMKFNSENHRFKLQLSDTSVSNTLTIRFLDHQLVTSGQQTGGVIVSTLGVVVLVALASAEAPIVLYFWYFPQVKSPAELVLSNDINGSPINPSFHSFNSPGFLRSEERQINKYGQFIQRNMVLIISKLEKSYKK